MEEPRQHLPSEIAKLLSANLDQVGFLRRGVAPQDSPFFIISPQGTLVSNVSKERFLVNWDYLFQELAKVAPTHASSFAWQEQYRQLIDMRFHKAAAKNNKPLDCLSQAQRAEMMALLSHELRLVQTQWEAISHRNGLLEARIAELERRLVDTPSNKKKRADASRPLRGGAKRRQVAVTVPPLPLPNEASQQHPFVMPPPLPLSFVQMTTTTAVSEKNTIQNEAKEKKEEETTTTTVSPSEQAEFQDLDDDVWLREYWNTHSLDSELYL